MRYRYTFEFIKWLSICCKLVLNPNLLLLKFSFLFKPSMKIDFHEVTSTNVKFTLHSNVSFANSLRRILLGELSCTAIDFIEIAENRSVLADEMLANRLGLIPVRHNHVLLDKTDCSCDNTCSKCAIIFDLNKTNDSNEIISVTGHDLSYTGPHVVEIHNTLIVKLAPRQSLNVRCVARRGSPKTHVKYCPVTAVSFTYDERNSKRHAKLWNTTEDSTNISSEWPMINQTVDVDWNPVDKVEMNVETVEGDDRPIDILFTALELFKSKMQNIYDEI